MKPGLDVDISSCRKQRSLPSARRTPSCRIPDGNRVEGDRVASTGCPAFEARGTDGRTEEAPVRGAAELAYAVPAEARPVSRMQLRGEPDKQGTRFRADSFRRWGGPLPPGTAGSGRLELAEWLTSPSNPSRRAMVNRIWEYHFRTGTS